MQYPLDLLDLIHQGKYDEAVEYSNFQYDKIIRSRVAELGGKFTDALHWANMAIEESEGNTLAFAYIASSYALWRLNVFDKGISNLKIAQDLLIDDSVYTRYLKALSMNIEGLIHWKDGRQLDIAMDLFIQSLRIREANSFEIEISYSLNNIVNTYLKLREFDNCYDYYQRAMTMRNKIGYLPSIAASYNSMGRYHDAMEEFDIALEYHQRCLEHWEKVGNKQFIAKTHRFIARTLKYMNKSDASDKHYNIALKIFSELKNDTDMVATISAMNK